MYWDLIVIYIYTGFKNKYTMILIFSVLVLLHTVEGSYLEFHNAARGEVNLPPLQWDSDLAKASENWARQCVVMHDPQKSHPENIAWGMPTLSTARACQLWISEKQFLNGDGVCDPGKVCGHYLNIINSNHVTLGCAVARCGTADFHVCRFGKRALKFCPRRCRRRKKCRRKRCKRS
jgi:hypothetical protein